jgi:translation initiation factor 2 subunit 2
MEEDEQAMTALFKTKKKRKEKKEEVVIQVNNLEQDEELSYDEMLARLFSQMEPTSASKRVRLHPPKLSMIGSKRTGWSNFETTAEMMKRDPQHLSHFVENELGTTVSHAKEGLLVIKGRFRTNQIESILKKYVERYVKCKTCHSYNTTLVRDPVTRLTSQRCDDCRSEWTVENIQKAFHAAK